MFAIQVPSLEAGNKSVTETETDGNISHTETATPKPEDLKSPRRKDKKSIDALTDEFLAKKEGARKALEVLTAKFASQVEAARWLAARGEDALANRLASRNRGRKSGADRGKADGPRSPNDSRTSSFRRGNYVRRTGSSTLVKKIGVPNGSSIERALSFSPTKTESPGESDQDPDESIVRKHFLDERSKQVRKIGSERAATAHSISEVPSFTKLSSMLHATASDAALASSQTVQVELDNGSSSGSSSESKQPDGSRG